MEENTQTQNPEEKTKTQKTNKKFKMGKLYKARRDSRLRIVVIVVLMVILAVLYFTWGKFRALLIGLFILLLVALGLETTSNDLDLGKLVETRSIEQSRIDKTDSGRWDIGGACSKNNLNCGNFEYQEDAQEVFEECGGLEDDVHRLDGDKDGLVCESLPSRN